MRVLILGATSDIAVALAQKWFEAKHDLLLAGRDRERIALMNQKLSSKDCKVEIIQFDALNFNSHKSFYESITNKPDIVVSAFGLLDSSSICSDGVKPYDVVNTNFVGAISILDIVAFDFELRKSGVIVGISSVAGDRGRMSNYIYGASKAGFTAYLSGLRNRLYHSGVHVVTVKPGFVRTKMTKGLSLPSRLTASPEQVAKSIVKAVDRKRNVVYVLPIWRVIMLVILMIPEEIFKRLKL